MCRVTPLVRKANGGTASVLCRGLEEEKGSAEKEEDNLSQGISTVNWGTGGPSCPNSERDGGPRFSLGHVF